MADQHQVMICPHMGPVRYDAGSLDRDGGFFCLDCLMFAAAKAYAEIRNGETDTRCEQGSCEMPAIASLARWTDDGHEEDWEKVCLEHLEAEAGGLVVVHQRAGKDAIIDQFLDDMGGDEP